MVGRPCENFPISEYLKGFERGSTIIWENFRAGSHRWEEGERRGRSWGEDSFSLKNPTKFSLIEGDRALDGSPIGDVTLCDKPKRFGDYQTLIKN